MLPVDMNSLSLNATLLMHPNAALQCNFTVFWNSFDIQHKENRKTYSISSYCMYRNVYRIGTPIS